MGDDPPLRAASRHGRRWICARAQTECLPSFWSLDWRLTPFSSRDQYRRVAYDAGLCKNLCGLGAKLDPWPRTYSTTRVGLFAEHTRERPHFYGAFCGLHGISHKEKPTACGSVGFRARPRLMQTGQFAHASKMLSILRDGFLALWKDVRSRCRFSQSLWRSAKESPLHEKDVVGTSPAAILPAEVSRLTTSETQTTVSQATSFMPKTIERENQDYATAPINAALTQEQKIGFLREMFRIRRFEQVALKQYNAGKMGGFLHLYIGQESVAVGTISLLGENDHVITAYRDHGHALMVGMSMKECMAELYGKATGCSKGKGGSMHFFAPDKNYWGGHGIVAGQTPLGLGLAYALKYQGIKGCCLCYLGDGAVNQGVYHESLNLAALWSIPVIYIIENNGYSMGTSLKRSSAYEESLASRAQGYGIAWDLVDGTDLYEVRGKTWRAIERAYDECRPTVIEIDTYRHYGHSVADANAKKYRTPEEIEHYKTNHDPLHLWKNRLIKEGVISEEAATELDVAAKKEADESARFAEESPFPEPEAIFQDVYWEVDQKTESGQRGRHFFND